MSAVIDYMIKELDLVEAWLLIEEMFWVDHTINKKCYYLAIKELKSRTEWGVR